MNLVDTIENEGNLEIVAEDFSRLVDNREYGKAKEYFDGLNDEGKKYIKRNEKYNWKLKAISMRSL
mgnify:FL=1